MAEKETALLTRLYDPEDSLVERKPKVDGDEVPAAVVAFANTVSGDSTGIVFVGVTPNGQVVGVEGDVDRAQRKARRLIDACYPPIPFQIHVLRVADGVPVLAIEVRESAERPHFTGAAYVRRGSETMRATEQLFQQLVEDRLSEVRWLRPWIGRRITVTRDHGLFQSARTIPFVRSLNATLRDVTRFYVWTVEHEEGGADKEETFSLQRITIEWDVQRQQPRLRVD